MIKKLFECGCFDYQKFILSHQHELLLSPSAILVLIAMIDEYQKNKFVSLDAVKQKIQLSDNEFDQVASNLLEREFYSFYIQSENGIGHEAISIDGFFIRVKEILDGINSKDLENDFVSATRIIQAEMNRTLTPSELEIISSLILEDRFTFDDIKEGLSYMKKQYKNPSIKNLVQSLNRYKVEDRDTFVVPDYVREFINNIK